MVKRLQGSASGNRSASTTDSTAEPEVKRRRLSPLYNEMRPQASRGLDGLPTEIHDLINHELVVPGDMITTLKHLGRVRKTSQTLKKGVAYSFGEKRVKQLNTALKGWNEAVARFPVEQPENTFKGHTQSYLRTQSDLIALHSKAGRRHITNGVLACKGDDFDEAAVLNIIRNINYIETDQRSKLVSHVAEHGLADHLIVELAARIDRVPVAERTLIVEHSRLLDEPNRSSALEHLAGHLNSLKQGDQNKLLAEAGTPSESRSRLLAAFGAHADAFEPHKQAVLVTGICELGDDDPYKMQGLSALSECFERLEPELQAAIAHQILHAVEWEQGPLGPDHPWYAAPQRSRIEALRSMSTKMGAEDNGGEFRFAIDRLKSRFRRPNPAVEAQLVPSMGKGERPYILNCPTPDSDALDEDVMYGLTLRVKNLDREEKVVYLRCVEGMDHDSDAYRNIVAYNLSYHLAAFTPEQRSSLVQAQLQIVSGDPIQADSAFKRIADGAEYLQQGDIRAAVVTAGELANNYSGEVLESSPIGASIKSCAGHTARGLDRWMSKILLREPKPVERPSIPALPGIVPADTGSSRLANETLYPERARPHLSR
ncbi:MULTISPECIES: hypothetical protein [unclassified Neorhizobium]|uniref:hypothetical protein n=1 Tax=unclassified Neorhizobium TaxID=2629175 RepID=UPI001FF3D0EF|nr:MULTISPECIES: hypothetical protein [unclassified Neorhizobium]MCJ9671596.1 hypothetical protein [Neorhizobium sp. SHOUNA12B]MCJ9747725.1 hypothetical protein [Neorhizobium sp. SHOUNA12A]